MLEVHGDLKETADTSIPTPSLSSWPVKQPNQGGGVKGGRGFQAPRGRKAPLQTETHAVPQETLASGWGGRMHLTAKDMQGW